MDFTKVKLAVAVPLTSDFAHSAFMHSFFCLTRPFDSIYIPAQAYGPLDLIRNSITETALNQGATHLIMCDTDQVYPKDTIVKLLKHDLDVVGGKVHRRTPPYDPILMRGEYPHYKTVPEEEWKDEQLVEVDATGTGCLLFKTHVFRDIEPPWFKFWWDKEDGAIGEDIHFCGKLREAGFKIFVDCSVKIGHIKSFVIEESSFFSYKFGKL